MIIVDTEASGLDPEKHSLVSIGALDFVHPENRYYIECHVWDGAHVMEDALRVNGFREEEVRDSNKPSEGEAIRDFLAWAEPIEEHTLAGQNVSFDRDMLKAATERAHFDWPFPFRTIDSHTLGYMHMVQHGLTPPTKNKRSALDLDAILNYVGIPSEPEPHNALTGALCHAEVISRLLYGKKLLPEFEGYEVPYLTL